MSQNINIWHISGKWSCDYPSSSKLSRYEMLSDLAG